MLNCVLVHAITTLWTLTEGRSESKGMPLGVYAAVHPNAESSSRSTYRTLLTAMTAGALVVAAVAVAAKRRRAAEG
jgi:hypothetical protein